MSQEKPIRLFIIGGVTGEHQDKDEQISTISKQLGEYLGKHGNLQIVVCSAHHSSIDAGVIEGFALSSGNRPGSVIIHHPADDRTGLKKGESIPEQWELLIKKICLNAPKIRENVEARVRSAADFTNAFLLCQIRALKENSDIVLVIGGRRDSAAAQLLAIARGTYPIVPFAFLGGAGEIEFIRQESSFRSSIKEQGLVDSLQSLKGINRAPELIEKIKSSHGGFHIFISYPWKRAAEADYVEAFLRRIPRITIFRDEEDIKSGEPISGRIKQQLAKCDLFLMLWCAEYAASPYCYDELGIIKKRSDCKLYILRLDDTRPVWPSLRTKQSHDWGEKWMEAKGREGIASSLNEMIRLFHKN